MGGAMEFIGPAISFVGASKAADAQADAAASSAAATREATAMSVASQEKMQQKALDAQEKALREQRQYLDPYRTAGTGALYQYLYRIGAGKPDAGTYGRAMADPSRTSRIEALRTQIAAETAKAQAAAQTPAPVQSAPSTMNQARGNASMIPPLWANAAEAVRTGTATPDQQATYEQVKQYLPGAMVVAQQAAGAAGATAQSGAAAVSPELAALQAELAQLEGAQGPAEEFTPWNLEESPTYKLQQEDTQRAIDRAARARGLYKSGYAMKTSADAGRRLAADEQQAQLTRLTGLASMGQEASAGMAGSGLSSANQMTSMYNQGASNYANIYERQAQGLGDAAYNAGAAKAGLWGNVSSMGQNMMASNLSNSIYGQPAKSSSGSFSFDPYATSRKLAGSMPGFGFMSY